jgi:dienelactone hydrolase
MQSKRISFVVVLMLLVMNSVSGVGEKKKRVWPEQVKEITYLSSGDKSMQPAMFYAPKTDKKVPLLVGLHTWSGNYMQGASKGYARWCIAKGWAFIHPNFRGPNWTPQAMGSELVVKDIISAVKYAEAHADIDKNRIYLVGGSGGGYASLLMAGRAPNIWAGVSVWCPISDLKKWHAQCKKAKRGYYKHIEKACQGIPGQSAQADEECRKRSAVTYLKNAKSLNIDINTGIHDGYKGSVPISHAFDAFNEVCAPEDIVSAEDITFFVEKQAVPEKLKKEGSGKVAGRDIHFRRTSGNCRITIFEGAHNILHNPSLNWLEQQRKGKPAVWKLTKQTKLKFSDKDSKVAK